MGTPTQFETEEIIRKNMVIFYLIDTSGSMSGAKINAVNHVMSGIAGSLANVQGAESEIKIAVMTFDDTVNWLYPEPIPADDFEWNAVSTRILTSMGAACKELNNKLSRSAFLKSPHLSFAPVIFLLSDGVPTDNFEDGLKTLKNNKWFKYAVKVAMAIGDDADIGLLEEFTGNKELVVKANNSDAIMRLVREVSITSSQISSNSRNLDEAAGEEPDIDSDYDKKVQQIADSIDEIKNPDDIIDDGDW